MLVGQSRCRVSVEVSSVMMLSDPAGGVGSNRVFGHLRVQSEDTSVLEASHAQVIRGITMPNGRGNASIAGGSLSLVSDVGGTGASSGAMSSSSGSASSLDESGAVTVRSGVAVSSSSVSLSFNTGSCFEGSNGNLLESPELARVAGKRRVWDA